MTPSVLTQAPAPSDTGADSASDLPLIHEAVALRAQLRPEATAIVFRGEAIDYRTLDAAADAYAVRLVALGVAPGDTVPVRMARGPQQVAALLAVLKCGAAYAAFDHRWPDDRVVSLLDQIRPPVLVSDSPVEAGPVPVWSPPEESLHASARRGGRPPRVELPNTAAACVFFTSGTTGTPKGVVSPHRATTRLFGPGGLRGYGEGRVTSQSAPCAWDAFTLELWGMLTTGGTAVIVEDDYLLPGVLRDVVAANGVDTIFLTSSLFNLFVDMDLDCFAGLRHLYTGGERLSAAHVRQFAARFPEIQLFNGYGPVEACVFATTHLVELPDCDTVGGVPIGSPVAETEVYVVSEGRICGPGEEGELCIGGAGLAPGSLGQPELTAEKFEPITVDGVAVRVYRTGDLCRLDEAGVLHFRGRADRQVKVRGYRIEPGEIENAAVRVPGVQRGVVVPVPGKTVTWERLVLFYTVDPGAEPVPTGTATDPVGLAAALAVGLPPYLVPDLVLAVGAFPMTANGKIDDKALLASLDG